MSHDPYAAPPNPAFRFLDADPPPGVNWLWPQRLPLGALSFLVGDPAVGKSLLTVDLAARLTAPSPWPDEPAAEPADRHTIHKLPPTPVTAAPTPLTPNSPRL